MPQGPLLGIKIVEFAGIGPGPFCGMLLSDLGADIVRIDRPGAMHSKTDVTARGRRSVTLDLKSDEGRNMAMALIQKADAIIEGYRPGVMEKLGLGPEDSLAINPRLIYGRMTGWGQTGPLAHIAGHDLNYIALSGALYAMGNKDRPPSPPLNLVGDFGGGALYLAMGICAALYHLHKTGEGQVIDCAMTDGATSLASMFYGMHASGLWTDNREANLLDGGAHFYNCYECSDGHYISIGSIEPQFYAILLEKTGLADDDAFNAQMSKSAWPELKRKLTFVFKQKTRQDWCEIMEGTDICFAPVLSLSEAPDHPHNKARETFINIDGVIQPAPTPRFSKSPGAVATSTPAIGVDLNTVLEDWSIES